MKLEPLIEILGIKSDVGFYIKIIKGCNYSSKKLLFDGIPAEPTHSSEWYKLKCKPKKITIPVAGEQINHRFELIDKAMESDVFPLTYKVDDVAIYDSYEYEYVWNPTHAIKKSLYKLAFDMSPDHNKTLKFVIQTICEIDKVEEYAGLSYDIQKTRWGNDGTVKLTSSDIKHQELDKILFPSLLLPSKPSALSSSDSYKIIRQFVKENINREVAEITSDYDFCFTVKKRIELHTPEKYACNVASIRSKTPRYETRFRKYRAVEVFEMTDDSHKYKGYTIIPGFTGKNHDDLKKNIDTFLADLIAKINEPLKDCPHCDGMGVI